MLRFVLLLCVLALLMRVTNSAISTEEFATLAAKTKPKSRPSRMPTKKPSKPKPSKPTKPSPSKPTPSKPTPSKPTSSSPKPAFATRVYWNGINCGKKASTTAVAPPMRVSIQHKLNVCSPIPAERGGTGYEMYSVDGTSIKLKYFSDASCKTVAHSQSMGDLNVCNNSGQDYSTIMQVASSSKEIVDKFTSNRVTFVEATYYDSACSNENGISFEFVYDGCNRQTPNSEYYNKVRFTSSGTSWDIFSNSDCTGLPVSVHNVTFEEMGFNQCTKSTYGDNFYKKTSLSQFLLAN